MDIDLLALLNALWRRKVWIALYAVIFLAAGWYEATRVGDQLDQGSGWQHRLRTAPEQGRLR